VIAVNIGVILAMLQFMRRMASSVEIVAQPGDLLTGALPQNVVVYAIEGPFFFGAVDKLERALAHTHTDPKFLILRLSHVPFMDITGIQALQEAMVNLERRDVRVMLCEANMRVLRKLLRAGLFPRTQPRRYFSSIAMALARIASETQQPR
jgi:SulP family sulfate permease